ncbi:MAG: PP2C family protein-serine/threonine phosphatase [Planctomycetota bacterium]|jgi:serine/threonine protein phosphatase PrpC
MTGILLESAGITDRGAIRTDNQDQFFVAELTRSLHTLSSSLALRDGAQLTGSTLGHFFMVADGMGGHRAGMEASRLAIQYFIASILNRVRWLSPKTDSDENALVEDLKVMLSESHREIKRQSEQDSELAGMGTTFTMAYVIWPRMYIVHAGDTRCYLFRKGELRLLTRDHTVAEQLMQSGRLTLADTQRSPWSNVLLNALGAGADEVHAEIAAVQLEEGDLLLLCSDGLNKHVTDAEIQSMAQQESNPQILCASLVDEANLRGGTDNITIVAARWRGQTQTERMPIYQSSQHDPSLLREIHAPSEEVDTSEMPTAPISTLDYSRRHEEPKGRQEPN